MKLALALAAALLAAGCISTGDGERMQLSSRTGDGSFFVAITLTPDGDVERTTAWWAETGQAFNTSAYHEARTMRGVAIKNDVGIEGDVPILTDGQRLVFLWSSDDAGAPARNGDTFEFYVMERATDRVLASATLTITG